MFRGCFYCKVSGEKHHLYGCPNKIRREAEGQRFGGATSNLEVVAIAVTPETDLGVVNAIHQYENGFQDGLTGLPTPATPNPSYRLGFMHGKIDKLFNAVTQKKMGSCAEGESDE